MSEQQNNQEKDKTQLPAVNPGKVVDISITQFHLNGKVYKLRLESPRTIRACKDLGIGLDYLQSQKGLADFKEKDKEIQTMKYNHYQNRMQQTVKDIIQQRRQIARSALGKQLVIQEQEKEHSVSSQMPNKIKSFNKNLQILNSQHYDNSPLEFIDVIEEQDQDFNNNRFQNQIDNEVSRYNKIKLQKQRIAKQILQQQERNLQISFNLRQKDENYQILNQKQQQDFQKIIENKHKFYNNRRQKIYKIEQNNLEKQRAFGQKLQERQNKAIQNAFSLSHYNPNDSVNQSKFSFSSQKMIRDQHVNEKKKSIQEAQNLRERQTMDNIIEKMDYSIHNSMSQQTQREMKIKQKQQQVEEKFARTQKIKADQENQQFQTIVSRMYAQNQNIEKLNQRIQEREKQRKKKEKEKLSKNNDKQNDLEQQWKDKSRKIEQRQKQLEIKVMEQKGELARHLELQNEKRKLQELDKKVNYERELNKNHFKYQMILEKQVKVNENMNNIKQQQEMVLQTRKQLNKKLAQEELVVNKSLNSLKNIFHSSHRAKSLSSHQITEGNKIINKMLNKQVGYNEGIFQMPLEETK